MKLRAVAIASVLGFGLCGPASADEPAHMHLYWGLFKYADNAMKAMLEHPQDRAAAARKLAEAFGGKLDAIYFTVPGGEFDGFAIFEFPDDATARASGMVVQATGNFLRNPMVPLLTAEEFKMAMEKAKAMKAGYAPPTETK
jgi:uncharacterized protein with GYD domain